MRRQLGTVLGSTAWIRPAAFDPRVAYLRLADDSLVPDQDEVAGWVERVRGLDSCATIRTSALFPRAAERFLAVGFAVVDTLALLRVDFEPGAVDRWRTAAAGAGSVTASIRGDEYDDAARIDRAAFGPRWHHGADELREVRFATPACQVRVRAEPSAGWRRGRFGVPVRDRRIDAFAIAGASTEHGYLQRLSVDPAAQRRGHGRTLTYDALAWMAGRRLRDCLVNTSVDNERALALYESTGFRRLPDHLRVLELDVHS